ncbi:hypothetical protein WKI25_08965 [Acinetobacter baumannii]
MNKVKFENIISLIAVLIPIFLGYFYICGQAFLEGITLNTGFDANFLELEFKQYFYYGFLYSFHYFIFIPILISLIWFTISLYKNLPKNTYKSNTNKETKNILNTKIKRLKSTEIVQKNDLSSVFVLISLFLVFFIIVLLLFPLKHWINLSDLGENKKHENILRSTTYTIQDNKKYYPLICGKNRCIYSNKNLNNFISIKDGNYNHLKLESFPVVNYFNRSTNTYAFKIEEEKKDMFKILTLQIQTNSKFSASLYLFNIKLRTTNGNHYVPTQTSLTNQLNELANLEGDPIFVSFKVFKNENIDYLYLHNSFLTN